MSLSPRILNVIKQAGEQILKEIEKEITPQPQVEKADRFDKTEGSCYDKPQEREAELNRKINEYGEAFNLIIRKIGNNLPTAKAPTLSSRRSLSSTAMDFVDAAVVFIQQTKAGKDKADQWDKMVAFFMEKGWDVDGGVSLFEWINQRLVSGKGDRVMPEETYQRLSGIQAQFNLVAANKTEEMLKVHEALRSIINKSTGGQFTEFATTGRLIEVATNTVESMRDLVDHYKKTFDKIISKGDEFMPKSEISEARSARAEAVVEKLYSVACEPRMTQEAHERGVATEIENAKKQAEGLLSSLAQNFFIRAGGAEVMGKYNDHKDSVVLIRACFTQMERTKEVAERDLGRRTHGNTYPWCDVRRDHHVIEIEHKKGSILRFLNINGGVEDRTKDVAARLRATADEMDPPAVVDKPTAGPNWEEGSRKKGRCLNNLLDAVFGDGKHHGVCEEEMEHLLTTVQSFKNQLVEITLSVGKEFALATDFANAYEQAVTHVSAAIFNHKKIVSQLWERVHAGEDKIRVLEAQIGEETKGLKYLLENTVIVGPGWKEEVEVTIGPNHATAIVSMSFADTVKGLMERVEGLEKENKRVTEQKSLGGWIAGEEHQKAIDEVATLKQTYNQLFEQYKSLEEDHTKLKGEMEKGEKEHCATYERLVDRCIRLQKVRKMINEITDKNKEDLGLIGLFAGIYNVSNQQSTKEEIQVAIREAEAERQVTP